MCVQLTTSQVRGTPRASANSPHTSPAASTPTDWRSNPPSPGPPARRQTVRGGWPRSDTEPAARCLPAWRRAPAGETPATPLRPPGGPTARRWAVAICRSRRIPSALSPRAASQGALRQHRPRQRGVDARDHGAGHVATTLSKLGHALADQVGAEGDGGHHPQRQERVVHHQAAAHSVNECGEPGAARRPAGQIGQDPPHAPASAGCGRSPALRIEGRRLRRNDGLHA